MIIKSSDIKSDTIGGICKELYNIPMITEIIFWNNLRGGDFVEAIASDILYEDKDIDTNDYLHIKEMP